MEQGLVTGVQKYLSEQISTPGMDIRQGWILVVTEIIISDPW